MNPIIVISPDAGAKAAVENVIRSQGFPVAGTPESPAENPRSQWTAHTTCHAFDQLTRLDATFIGTPDYMGIAYFWHWEYRHYLRDATTAVRVQVHDRLIQAGLSPSQESPEHLAIIEAITNPK